jgi:hypothetical protein
MDTDDDDDRPGGLGVVFIEVDTKETGHHWPVDSDGAVCFVCH